MLLLQSIQFFLFWHIILMKIFSYFNNSEISLLNTLWITKSHLLNMSPLNVKEYFTFNLSHKN